MPKLDLKFPLSSTLPPYTLILLTLSIFAVIMLLLWAFMGTLHFTVKGKGIVLKENSLEIVRAPVEGKVKAFRVAVGKIFDENEVLIEMETGEKVVSPYPGKLLEILTPLGSLIEKNTPLLWVEKSLNTPLVIYGYFPLDTGSRLQPNMSVTINESYQGSITKVFHYPVSKESLLNDLFNPKMIAHLTANTTLIKVEIEPSYSFKLPSGTIVELEAHVEWVRPIFYIFPLPQFKRGYEPS